MGNARALNLISAATAGVPKLNASIASFRGARDGWGAWESAERQHRGEAGWENAGEEPKKAIGHLACAGAGPAHALGICASKRRNAWSSWSGAAPSITAQAPLESELAAARLKGIKCNSSNVCAAAALAKNGKGIDGIASNFELAATCPAKECPAAEKLRSKANASAAAQAAGIGEDGMALDEPNAASNGATAKAPFGKAGACLGWISDPKVPRSLAPEQRAGRAALPKRRPGGPHPKRNVRSARGSAKPARKPAEGAVERR